MDIEKGNKKIAAAIAGVMTYIKQDEEAAMQAGAQIPYSRSLKCESCISMWSISGRQQMMNMRSMMQLKAFYR